MRKSNSKGIVTVQRRKATGQAELTILQAINPNVSMVDGIPTEESLNDLMQAYRVHSWVYTAAWTVASNLAGLEWQAFRQNADELWEKYPKHELLPLLKRPNPYMTAYQLREFTYLCLELAGNAYWAFERANGKILQIWPVPAGGMRAVSTKEKFIDHFLYSVNGKDIRFEYNEILHFKYIDPNDMVYGQGSLTAVKLAVAQDLYAQSWNKYFFRNSGRPDSALQTDQVLSEDVRRRIMKSWEAMHVGADKKGKLAVFEGGLKYQEINRTPKDLDFASLRNLSREEILSAFGVPPIMAGVLDQTNYNTAREQKKIFWERTLIPKKHSTDEVLTLRASQLFFDPLTIFEADTSHVEALRADMQQLSVTAKNFYEIGIPLNEVIDKLDLPFDPVEGGDVPVAFGALNTHPNQGVADQGTPPADSNAPPPPKHLGPSSIKDTRRARLDAIWKTFDQRTREREADMALDVRGFFGGQWRRVIAALRQYGDRLLQGHVEKATPLVDISVIFNDKAEMAKMRKATDKHIAGTYFDFAVRTARELGGGSFDLENPRSIDYLTRKEIKLVTEATQYTMEKLAESVKDGVREAVEEGLKRGEAIDSIAARIDDFYEFSRESRSTRIARTETISASNAGSLDAMKEAGVERKAWLSSQDDRVRDTHQEMDGQEVGIDEAFISPGGATLDFPGDPDAPPSESINCRCKVLSVLNDQETRGVGQIVVRPKIEVQVPKVRKENITLVRDKDGRVTGSEAVKVYDGEK
jgi:HK97 family phage portal protein